MTAIQTAIALSPLHALAGSEKQLATTVAIVVETELMKAPYLFANEKSPTRLDRASRWVLEGRVSPLADSTEFYVVQSSQADKSYTLHGTKCPCAQATKGKTRHCYHSIAVYLYQRTLARLQLGSPAVATSHVHFCPAHQDLWSCYSTCGDGGDRLCPTCVEQPTLGLPAMTIDERLAQLPKEPPMPATPPLQIPTATPLPEPESVAQPTYALALPRCSIQAIIADLSKPLPATCVASKTVQGQPIAFLHWQTVARLLDTYAPGWHGCVTRVDQVGTACAITYRLTIPCAEGEVSREATGQEEEEVKGYGDSTSNAEAMAFKRAAAKFGLGRWLYDKDATGEALAQYLKAEKHRLLEELGKACDKAQLDRKQFIERLKQQTGASHNVDLPISALRAQLSYVTTHATP